MQVYSTFNPRHERNYYKQPFYKKKRFYIIIILLTGAIGFLYYSINLPNTDDSTELTVNILNNNYATVNSIAGTAEAETVNGDKLSLLKDTPIEVGTTITTGADTRLILTLPDTTLLRLASNTEIKIKKLAPGEIIIEQNRGNLYSRVSKDSPAIYRVDYQNAQFIALGTGFNTLIGETAEITVIEGSVKIKIIDRSDEDNTLNMRTLDEGYVGSVNFSETPDNMIISEAKDAAELIDQDWIAWNNEEDKKLNLYQGIFAKAIPLNITAPATNELTAESAELEITGTTDSEAEIFIMGHVVKNKAGQFTDKITLSPGKNTIEIVVQKDRQKNKKIIYAEYQNTPINQINLVASQNGSSIDLTWTIDQTTTNEGFRVVMNTTGNPTYPESSFHIIPPGATSDTWSALPLGKYYFRTCLYQNKNCTLYSNESTIELTADEPTPKFNLQTRTISNTDVTLQIETSLREEFDNLKVLISNTINPEYPGTSNHTLAKTATQDIWRALNPGTYYFRLCAASGDTCIKYSDSLEVTLEPIIDETTKPTIDETTEPTQE